MAQYFTDFSEYSTGSLPSDWTERWDASGRFTVETGGADKVLFCSAANSYYLCSWDDVDADSGRATVEVVVKASTAGLNNTGSNPIIGLAVRASDTGSSEDGYYAGIRNGTTLTFNKLVDANFTAIATATISSISTGTFYWLRFKAVGDTFYLRFWSGDAGDEPTSTWDIDGATDSAHSAAGWVGVVSRASSVADDPSFELVGIGTNGDAAPTSAGGGAVTGTSSGTFTLSGSAAGAVQVDGASSAAFTLSGTGVGAVGIAGASTAAFTLTGAGEGTVLAAGLVGTSTAAFTLTGASAGEVLVAGTSTGAFAVSGMAAGELRVDGASAAAFTLTGTGAGTVAAADTRIGESTAVFTLTGSGTGAAAVAGTSTAAFVLSGTAAGQIRVDGTSAGAFTLEGSGEGTVLGTIEGSSVGSFDLLGSATGVVVGTEEEAAQGGGAGWPILVEDDRRPRVKSTRESIRDIIEELDEAAEEMVEAVSGEVIGTVAPRPVDVAAIADRMTPRLAARDAEDDDDDLLLLSF